MNGNVQRVIPILLFFFFSLSNIPQMPMLRLNISKLFLCYLHVTHWIYANLHPNILIRAPLIIVKLEMLLVSHLDVNLTSRSVARDGAPHNKILMPGADPDWQFKLV